MINLTILTIIILKNFILYTIVKLALSIIIHRFEDISQKSAQAIDLVAAHARRLAVRRNTVNVLQKGRNVLNFASARTVWTASLLNNLILNSKWFNIFDLLNEFERIKWLKISSHWYFCQFRPKEQYFLVDWHSSHSGIWLFCLSPFVSYHNGRNHDFEPRFRWDLLFCLLLSLLRWSLVPGNRNLGGFRQLLWSVSVLRDLFPNCSFGS